jgi:hypothetical protein
VADEHELGQDVLLGRVVRVQGRRVDAHSGSDAADRGAVEAVLGEQLQRRVQDPASGTGRRDTLRQLGGHRLETPGLPVGRPGRTGVGHRHLRSLPGSLLPDNLEIRGCSEPL